MPVSDYETFAKLVDEGRHADIEEAMCGRARAELDGIADCAYKTVTHRAGIIRDAVDAHRAGTYSLSIPVLFAQSDGIAKEIMGKCRFEGYAPKALGDILDKFDEFPFSEFSDILLDPLRSKSCFYTCSTRQVLKCGETLANRSAVLHGSQLDYASEANSLRVIVLLGYLLRVKSLLESHTDEVGEFREAMAEAMHEAMASDETPGTPGVSP